MNSLFPASSAAAWRTASLADAWPAAQPSVATAAVWNGQALDALGPATVLHVGPARPAASVDDWAQAFVEALCTADA